MSWMGWMSASSVFLRAVVSKETAAGREKGNGELTARGDSYNIRKLVENSDSGNSSKLERSDKKVEVEVFGG